jgi:hypothetical protein
MQNNIFFNKKITFIHGKLNINLCESGIKETTTAVAAVAIRRKRKEMENEII